MSGPPSRWPPVLDPRGRVERRAQPLAPRPDAARLRRGPVLLYDNGKLAEGAYPAVFQRLRELLAGAGVPAATDRAWPAILEGLSSPAATLAERWRAVLPLDATAPSADGLLDVTPWLEGDAADPEAWHDGVLAAFSALRIGDGLPLVPPTPRRYAAILAFAPWPPAAPLVRDLGPAGATLTVRELAVAAVMAGCRPEQFPIVVTAGCCLARAGAN